MAKKEIRSKYIKSLMEDKANLINTLEESTKESLSSMLDEKVNRSLRNMLNESEDDSYEEEVKPEEFESNDTPEETDTDENEQIVDLEGDYDNNDNECENGVECDRNREDDEVWDEVEDCKDAEGEYDLRGKDINTVLRLLQTMDENDGIRIIKNDDNTATVEPEGDEDEFVIDIEASEEPNEFEDGINANDENDDDDYIDIDSLGVDLDDIDELESSFNDSEEGVEDQDGDDDGETTFELEIEDGDDNEDNEDNEMVNEGQVNLGYTTNYQSKTAMTLPSDKGEGEGDSRFDNGAPKGGANNKKRWVGSNGANGGNPYSNKTKQPVSEMDECGDECIFEVEMDDNTMPMDETHTRGMARKHNSVGRVEVPNTNCQEDEEDTRNIYVGASQKRNTSRNESNLQEMQNKLNDIMNENAQLRDIMNQFRNKLNEAVVINASLAKATKLFTENSTTRDEKINILSRFDKVQSLNECKNLYNQISNELKGAHSINNNLLNRQLTEAKGTNKNMIVETNMLGASDEIKRILDLQNRLENK